MFVSYAYLPKSLHCSTTGFSVAIGSVSKGDLFACQRPNGFELPAPEFSRGPVFFTGSGPAKQSSDYRAELAGPVAEHRLPRRLLAGAVPDDLTGILESFQGSREWLGCARFFWIRAVNHGWKCGFRLSCTCCSMR